MFSIRRAGRAPVSMRGQRSCLASFLTQHSPATTSARPLISCIGTAAPRITRTSALDNLQAMTTTLYPSSSSQAQAPVPPSPSGWGAPTVCGALAPVQRPAKRHTGCFRHMRRGARMSPWTTERSPAASVQQQHTLEQITRLLCWSASGDMLRYGPRSCQQEIGI